MVAISSPGTPGSAQHSTYLLALGRANFEAAKVAMIATDLLRVLGSVPDEEMHTDVLGTLENRLRGLAKRRGDVPELVSFIERLRNSREARNDLIHALPVHSGLYRRTRDRIREFYTIESLDSLASQFTETYDEGLSILYRNDGAEVNAWYTRDPDIRD